MDNAGDTDWSVPSEDHEADVISVSPDIDYCLLDACEALPDVADPDEYENFEPMITWDFTLHSDFINSPYSVTVKSTTHFSTPIHCSDSPHCMVKCEFHPLITVKSTTQFSPSEP